MLIKKTVLSNKLGLHARATLKLVNTAERFQSHIEICFQEHSVNAKNMLELMTLGAACGAPLEIKISGLDENEAMQAVMQLIEGKFEEE